MKIINRREALGALSAFAVIGQLAQAQTPAPSASPAVRIIKFVEIPVTHNATGAVGRNIPQDLIPAGDVMGVHITTIDPGKEYGPMRKSTICEIRMIHSGKLELLVEGIMPQTANAGDIVVAPANQTYQVRNSGDVPLTYFILQIKPSVKAGA